MNRDFESAIKRLFPRTIRNWLRSPQRSLEWLRDEIRHSVGADVAAEIRPGWTVFCHPAALRTAYSAQMHDPEQIEEFDVFIRSVTKGCTLFDLGAHFGLFSFAALHFGGSTARAIAVDPSPVALRMIRVQARRNGIRGDRLRMVEAAIGSKSGETKMVTTGVFAAGYYLTPKANHGATELSTTRMISVDDLAQSYGVTPTHIKVDVEGAELAALRGSVRTLALDEPPLLCLELHNEIIRGRGQDPSEILRFLEEARYVITRVCGVARFTDESILERDVARVFAERRAA